MSAVVPDARRRGAGDAVPWASRGNAADGSTPLVTRRATRCSGAPAALLVVSDDTASIPPRVLHQHRKTLSRGHVDFYHGLLAVEARGVDGRRQLPRLGVPVEEHEDMAVEVLKM